MKNEPGFVSRFLKKCRRQLLKRLHDTLLKNSYLVRKINQPELDKNNTAFQSEVSLWIKHTFGQKCLMDPVERNRRFLEEALELVQACGASKEEALTLVDYVYDRPVGVKGQEVGGVMVTLAGLCEAHEINMTLEGNKEIRRCWCNVEKIRSKQAAKPQHISSVE